MNHRRYYFDAYTTSFEAHVVEDVVVDGAPAVVLEETYFYPTSGGQPNDTGWIGGSEVIDVVNRPADEAIIHILGSPLREKLAPAEIDWERRFDHMQQHTGQHILSQSFERTLEAKTLSFHMGAVSSTVDVDIKRLEQDAACKVEELANKIVWENRAVTADWKSRDEATQYPMRKPPPTESDFLRLVFIDDFDVSACGGTHVSRTGEVGLVKILGWERKRNGVRVEFVSGKRALMDYDEKNQIIKQLSARFTTSFQEIERSVDKLSSDFAQQRKLNKKLRRKIIELDVDSLLAEMKAEGESGPLIKVFDDKTPQDLRELASRLKDASKSTILFASVSEATHLVFVKHHSSTGDMNLLLARVFELLGSGSGGGSENFAQGMLTLRDVKRIRSVLTTVAAEVEPSGK